MTINNLRSMFLVFVSGILILGLTSCGDEENSVVNQAPVPSNLYDAQLKSVTFDPFIISAPSDVGAGNYQFPASASATIAGSFVIKNNNPFKLTKEYTFSVFISNVAETITFVRAVDIEPGQEATYSFSQVFNYSNRWEYNHGADKYVKCEIYSQDDVLYGLVLYLDSNPNNNITFYDYEYGVSGPG